ncbi:hypothetical protein G9F73_014840 [Clostridium estertheticum]|uniref:beta-ketoacyl synthase N-terminal-like domain-containing protein n=1 Tax=Clostridium estertheticum TaxID=238834 RepID=UPI0013EEC2AD|nr:beta-ketoacyl synthase N-terminal-like domain-containing protein [Clostridium estertheticum]MBZ9609078.1 hypothetical protein [Clostridium estertheticum]
MKTSNEGIGYKFNSFREVVVAGMGIISTVGNSIEEFEVSLRDGKSGISYIKDPITNSMNNFIGAEIKEEELFSVFSRYQGKLMKKSKHLFKTSNKSTKGAILAGAQAWINAKLDTIKINEDRIGIVVGGSNISPLTSFNMINKCKDSLESVHHRYALNFMDTNQVSVLSEIFNLKGEGFTVGGASASGNIAILKAVQMIQLGIVNACMVIGSMAELSPIELKGFENIGAYGGKSFIKTPEKACRPFDKDHEGFIYGQATACLILEGIESAKERQVEVLATVVGGAETLDSNSLSNPNEDGEVKTMEMAIKSANLDTSMINYINTHGTSTPLGDVTELRAIKRVFKGNINDVWINSTKPFTGHCLYAAGVVEAIATIIQLRAGFVHPQINLDNPIDNEYNFPGNKAEKGNFIYGLNNSYGFGGINTSVILKKGGV